MRSGEGLEQLPEILKEFDAKKFEYEILFLECATDVLIKRYKETRHNHPWREKEEWKMRLRKNEDEPVS